MNKIITVVWVGFVGVFAIGRSVHSFIMVDGIIFNGFDNHLHPNHHPQPEGAGGSGSLWVAGSALA